MASVSWVNVLVRGRLLLDGLGFIRDILAYFCLVVLRPRSHLRNGNERAASDLHVEG